MVTPRISGKPFQFAEPAAARGEELDAAVLSESLPRFTEDRLLRPLYDAGSAGWLLQSLADNGRYGVLRKTLVRDADGKVQGWYLYLMKSNGVAEVVQLVGERASIDAVLDHLFFHAREQGAIAVTGQVDPAFFRNLSDRYCIFHHPTDSWLMLDSKDPEILHVIEAGKAFLTRLEGEWWISSILG
jgi:hypothetical protein